jgi:hypothetical protein
VVDEVDDVRALADELEESTDDDTDCTRCDAPLIHLGEPDLVEGGSSILPRAFENRMRLEMWACSECGHVEFFMPMRGVALRTLRRGGRLPRRRSFDSESYRRGGRITCASSA